MKNLITCLSVCVLSGATFATTWTVDDDGKADFDNIQAAVDAASDGDEIIVMPGTYTSTAGEVVNMRGKEIWLHSKIGPEVTIISGEGVRRVLVCRNNETEQTIIEGLTIAEGYDEEGARWGYGAGLSCNESSPTIRSCYFINNNGYQGGGCGTRHGSPSFFDCLFESNRVTGEGVRLYPWGGAIMADKGDVIVENTTFKNNASEYTAGAVGVVGPYPGGTPGPDTSIYLYDCEFEANSVGGSTFLTAAGACCFGYGADVLIDQCSFLNNTNYSDSEGGIGGAIAVLIGEHDGNPSTVIKNSTFENNNVVKASPKSDQVYGGAIFFYVYTVPSVCSIENCSFAGNEAVTSGGALSVFYSNYEFLNIFNSTFCESTPNHIDGKWIDGGKNTFADECPPDCPDINGDGYVNVTDLLSIIDQWGLTNSPADVNFDGIVDVSDLLIVVGNWGPCE